MFVLGELLRALALLVSLVFNIFYFILVVRIILSWVNPDPYNNIVQIVYAVTEPVLAPLRRLPLTAGGVDFSPVLAFMILYISRNFLVNILYQLSYRLG
jgi:YggT family protein